MNRFCLVSLLILGCMQATLEAQTGKSFAIPTPDQDVTPMRGDAGQASKSKAAEGIRNLSDVAERLSAHAERLSNDKIVLRHRHALEEIEIDPSPANQLNYLAAERDYLDLQERSLKAALGLQPAAMRAMQSLRDTLNELAAADDVSLASLSRASINTGAPASKLSTEELGKLSLAELRSELHSRHGAALQQNEQRALERLISEFKVGRAIAGDGELSAEDLVESLQVAFQTIRSDLAVVALNRKRNAKALQNAKLKSAIAAIPVAPSIRVTNRDLHRIQQRTDLDAVLNRLERERASRRDRLEQRVLSY